jgi:tetratricopeptide (TPR) repeat protein
MRRHDYEKEAALRDRVRAEPAQAERHSELAAWLSRAGRLAQAKEALRQGLSRAQETARLQHLLGLVFAGAEEYESAERHLSRAAEREPMRFEYLRDLALVQGAAGRTASSVATLRQAEALGGEGANVAWLVRLGEKGLAETGARRERQPPPVPRRLAAIEQIVTRDPEVAEAIVARRPERPYEDTETLRAARRALGRLAAQHPSYPDLHFGLSLIAEQLGEIDRAIEAAEKALSINPRYAEACLLAVRLYERQGQPAKAAEHCLRATELRPTWPDTHLRLGRLMDIQGRPREAADVYRKVLTLNGKCEEARRRLDALGAAVAADAPAGPPSAGREGGHP